MSPFSPQFKCLMKTMSAQCFLKLPSADISELRGVGSDIIQVQAVDPDSSNLSYSLIGTNNNFEIDATTGLVILRSPLDFELRSVYLLVVSVTDRVTVSAPSNVSISVQVLDENDNSLLESLTSGMISGVISQ